MPSTLNLQLNPVNVELPLPVAIPADYVADKSVRLGLYRRMADMRSPAELDALREEFQDRFGPPPKALENLLYQLKVKLLAEQAGLASIVTEGRQIVLRYPDGSIPEGLPDLGPNLRVGKVALWLGYSESSNWMDELIEILTKLQSREAEAAALTARPGG
jgi:transcription-repair coupling factor (superfamily II helicase)